MQVAEPAIQPPQQAPENQREPLLVALPGTEADFAEGLPLPYVRIGEFSFPRDYGEVRITDVDLDRIVENYKRGVRRQDTPIVVDGSDSTPATRVVGPVINEEHAALPEGVNLNGYVGPGAVGWIKDMYRDGDTVYAVPDYNALGERLMREDRYRGTSPELLLNWSDPETGEKWGMVPVGLALTNRPRMKGLAHCGSPMDGSLAASEGRVLAFAEAKFAYDSDVHIDQAMPDLSVAYAFPSQKRLPLHSPAAVKGAKARFMSVEAAESERDAAWARLKEAAQKHGVEIPGSWRQLNAAECAAILMQEGADGGYGFDADDQSNNDADRAFVQELVRHHRNILDRAQQELRSGNDQHLRRKAQKVIDHHDVLVHELQADPGLFRNEVGAPSLDTRATRPPAPLSRQVKPMAEDDTATFQEDQSTNHPPFKGTHTHPHPAFDADDGEDGKHSHKHRHNNDASHDHSHAAMSNGAGNGAPADMSEGSEESEDAEPEEVEAAELTTAARKKLPNSAFAGAGRRFPVADAAHARNALARFPIAHFDNPAEKRSTAQRILAACKKFGINVSSDSAVAKAAKATSMSEITEQEAPETHGHSEGQETETQGEDTTLAPVVPRDQEFRLPADFAETVSLLRAAEASNRDLRSRLDASEQRVGSLEQHIRDSETDRKLSETADRLEGLVRTGRVTPAEATKYREQLAQFSEHPWMLEALEGREPNTAVDMTERGTGAEEKLSEGERRHQMALAEMAKMAEGGADIGKQGSRAWSQSYKEALKRVTRRNPPGEVGYRG